MGNSATFSVTKKDLLPALKKILKLEKTSRKKESTLEITLLNGIIRLVIPGIEMHVNALTNGSAKFTILLWYITNIVNAESDKVLHFIVEDKTLKLRGFSFNVQTTFFENDRILRSISLPLNYKLFDVLKLYLSEKYTTEELEFNKINVEVSKAIDQLNSDIDKTTSLLKKYGFDRDEVANLILKKLR